MKPKLSIWILSLLLSVASVFSLNYFQPSNAGLVLSGGVGYVGYASNYLNQYSFNATVCDTAGATTNALAFDISGDGKEEIIFVDDDLLYAYTGDCNLLTTYQFDDSVTQIIETNIDTDNYPEVTALINDVRLLTIEFDTVDWEVLIASPSASSQIRAFGCDYTPTVTGVEDSLTRCVAVRYNAVDTFQAVANSQHQVISGWTLGANATILNTTQNIKFQTKWLPFSDDGTGVQKAVLCNAHDGVAVGTYVGCLVLDLDGNLLDEWLFSGSDSVQSFFYSISYFAKVGTLYRILSSFDYRQITGGLYIYGNVMYSTTGTSVYQRINIANPNYHYLGNWMVGDYDLSGTNEACYFESDTDFIRCINSGGTNYLTHNYTGINATNSYKNFGMAQFDNESDYLAVAGDRGLWVYNTSLGYAVKRTDISLNSENRREGLISIFDSDWTPFYFVSSNTSGKILANPFSTISCGNGICEAFENQFTCWADCQPLPADYNETGEGCNNDEDCLSGKCEAGFCVLKVDGERCTADSQCLSGDCTNGRCARAGLWPLINESKKNWFGTDSDTGNFLSMFFMVGIPLTIILALKSMAGLGLGIVLFFAQAVFFTIVGWLSPFILIISLLVGLILVVLAFVIGGSSD